MITITDEQLKSAKKLTRKMNKCDHYLARLLIAHTSLGSNALPVSKITANSGVYDLENKFSLKTRTNNGFI